VHHQLIGMASGHRRDVLLYQNVEEFLPPETIRRVALEAMVPALEMYPVLGQGHEHSILVNEGLPELGR
jgi:hypothetical protein